MTIRPATRQDSRALTEISFSSKNYWNYPAEYFAVWRDELTITAEYIESNYIQIIEIDRQAVGYYSLTEQKEDLQITGFLLEKGIWLEHVFILPKFIGRGYGTKLMQHLMQSARSHRWNEINILADPHSTKFYQKLGATYIKEIPSNIAGRSVSFLQWKTAPFGEG